MIWLCICLTLGHIAEPGDANHSLSLAPESAVTPAVSRDAPGLNPTARSVHGQGYPCAHEQFNIDVCSGRRDYPLGSNASLGFAQVNTRPTVPLPSGVADRARSRGRASQASSTIDHEVSFTLLSPGHGQDRDKPLAILFACGSDYLAIALLPTSRGVNLHDPKCPGGDVPPNSSHLPCGSHLSGMPLGDGGDIGHVRGKGRTGATARPRDVEGACKRASFKRRERLAAESRSRGGSGGGGGRPPAWQLAPAPAPRSPLGDVDAAGAT